MDRRLIAGLFALCVAFGCAHNRSAMPETGNNDPLAVNDGLPSIKDVINKAESPRDTAMQRAQLATEIVTPKPGVPTAKTPTAAPAGRPAPYANQAPAIGRPVAPITSVKPTEESPRPAPYSGKTPANARPQSNGQPAPAAPLVGSNTLPVPEPEPVPLPIAPRELAQATTPPPPRATAPIDVAPPTQAKTLAAMPPLLPAVPAEPVVASNDTPPPVTISAGVRATDKPTVDANVVQTSAPQKPSKPGSEVTSGGQAAMVGTEVITLEQLRRHLKEQLERIPPEQKRDPQFQRMVVDGVLNKLIERTLVIQAVKKQIKDPKNLQSVYDSIDKTWTENELPPLLRANNCANIYELKRKFKEQGKSLEAMREDWRLDTLSREFMLSKIQSKLTVSLPERQKYYREHLADFKRPAQMTWREITIDNAKCASRAEARQKIDAIMARLLKGEDFAKIAMSESHGATAREGGKWETAPGGYAVPDINEALAKLPEGGLSNVVEAPGGFHIVRMEANRAAGPARFDEVSDEIKEIVIRQKFAKLSDAFVENLKSRTIVTTMFDTPKSDPAAVRTSGEQPSPRP